ncbi:3-oxoacyl-[acyl-carrier-protein] reductase [Lewinella sp. W8]|uniref:3-oxoacyl-[acyl-carrier-protein] reductase n=1 Tax=Lewinella sp. W8 TaxID=2528208 RepID=UPI0010677C28|nr:3-oxoacyl-[acyl-carrier-protein] reductase [Lewinella sp. W8]MTB53436.1 3-oxoacyl-[acyl-carrier-protein] reductase [Lewinella sp. W8]
MLQLTGRVAIITGAARGIGKVTAEKFAQLGATIAAWDIDERAGQQLVASLTSAGHDAKFYLVNTTDQMACQQAAASVVEDFGKVDILINNAGITRDSSFKKMTTEQWQLVLDVNLTGVFHATKAVFPFMAEAGYGRILNASSVVGLYGNFGQTNYAATKAGLIGMTKTWAREFGRKGITVNAVAPGFIATEMTAEMPEAILKGMEEKTPMQRLGLPEDIANAYAFLASDAASFITGTCLSVDGGLVL